MKNAYVSVIGLEIHVELKTINKMFCQCESDYFGKKPNTNTCPVCLGMPGALPVPNKKAIEWTMLIAKALNCKINNVTKFDRKHYFYPDLPKGYQISQYDEPIGIDGKIGKFRIRRVHLEEDTGKLIHTGVETLIDFNRCGVPLVEIVTEPDFKNSEDVKEFLEELHTIIKEYLQVSDANMERGDMRLEPNVSLREVTSSKLPSYKVEVKNINSFKFAQKAVDYEIKRQGEILKKGETPIQETRGFNETKAITFSQRTKEEAHDYRYFPEPDIPRLEFTDKEIRDIESQLPEMPSAKLVRYVKQFRLKKQDAFILTRRRFVAELFESAIKKTKENPQSVANLIINKKLNSIGEILSQLVPKKTNDDQTINLTLVKIIQENKKATEDYKAGKENAMMFLVGQVMKRLKGRADANHIKQLLINKLTQ